MSRKRKHTPRQASSTSAATTSDGVVTGPNYPTEEIKWWREAIEGLVIAIVLALLIRGFEAEAFVIPTGSMAPTLRGRHKDVACEQCEYQYASGASLESETTHGQVVMTTCPMCGFPQEIRYEKSRDASFAGDRILVNKFSYDPFGEPERFDVIVFKNPNDAKQNYIKRLCGLPGETVKLFRGDIYVMRNDATDGLFKIARKPPKKMIAMLQPVHDTKFIAPLLDEKGLPPRWQVENANSPWSSSDRNRTFDLAPSPDLDWIRYRHIMPYRAWASIKANQEPAFEGTRGELISDFYAYNSYLNAKASFNDFGGRDGSLGFRDRATGKNWVGDLAVECDVEVQSDTGELVLDLVEGGWHFSCTLDVSTGNATMSIRDPSGDAHPFKGSPTVTQQTKVSKPGTYRLLFSNVDAELRLWVDGKFVEFDSTTTYSRRASQDELGMPLRPFYGGPDNPGDLAPVGVGGRNLAAHIGRIRIHRDKYYVAVKGPGFGPGHDPTAGDYVTGADAEDVRQLFRSPEEWAFTELFDRMQQQTFVLEDFEDDSKDQFFPMGDNSPQSHDARVWNATANYVERQFLIGEAVLIYYPHAWHAKLPGKNFRTVPLLFYPKFSRMGIIR